MTTQEKVKHIREITMSPMNKISKALEKSNGDVDGAIKILIEEKQADTTDIANRATPSSIVYSYVHNNRIGAMIVLSCQTDFVAKNELFLQLAKDICIHVVSNPVSAKYVNESDIDEADKQIITLNALIGHEKKPQEVQKKIAEGKLNKYLQDYCLLNQQFVKNPEITIKQLIQSVSSTVGERIQIKKFIRLSA